MDLPVEGSRLTGPLTLRHAVRDDLDALDSLENRAFSGDQLSRRSLRYYIATRTAALLVLVARGVIVGDALVAFRRGSRAARLYSIAVDPDRLGQGLGRRLLAGCEAAASSAGRISLRLEVREDNAPAIALYRNAGYRQFGRYPDYYEDGTAALRFEKALDRPDLG